MNNIIIDITDNNIPISTLLRRSKILATKKEESDFLVWVNQELNGYGRKDKCPEYRKISGEVKFWNPMRGWCPVIFKESKHENQFTKRYAGQSVIELEELLTNDSSDYLMPYDANTAEAIMNGSDFKTKVSLVVSRASIKGILDSVRNLLLDQMLKWEKEGFTLQEEKNEVSQILKIINLLDYKLRKTVRTLPVAEKEIQDAFENILIGADIPYSRETDSIEYSSKTYIPDFTVEKEDLAIEIKLSNKKEREKEIIAEINDDILAYKIKYKNIIFVIYDVGFIRDIERFSKHFEDQEGIIIKVVKH